MYYFDLAMVDTIIWKMSKSPEYANCNVQYLAPLYTWYTMSYGFKPLKPFELNISKAVRDKLVKRINAIIFWALIRTANNLDIIFLFWKLHFVLGNYWLLNFCQILHTFTKMKNTGIIFATQKRMSRDARRQHGISYVCNCPFQHSKHSISWVRSVDWDGPIQRGEQRKKK